MERIDYVIQNHIEPDHSGSCPEIFARIPDAPIYCTAGAQKGLMAYYGKDFHCKLVKMGDTLNTGKYTFHFIPAPMVHWPDSMLTYLAEEKSYSRTTRLGSISARRTLPMMMSWVMSG